MNSEGIQNEIRECAQSSGIGVVGFARMEGLQTVFHESIRNISDDFMYGISLGFRLSDTVVENLVDGPTLLYKHQYKTANWILDQCAARVVRILESAGRRAMAIPASQTVDWEEQVGHLSHKAVAARSGLGWIGRSGLLVSGRHGGRLRFSTVLTDQKLPAGDPVPEDCGQCRLCVEMCPAGAITDNGYLKDRCLAKLKSFAGRPGVGVYICGMCVKACPVSG
jgi:epoxyqueuosine reductase QueG